MMNSGQGLYFATHFGNFFANAPPGAIYDQFLTNS